MPILFTAGRTPITEEGGLTGARDTHIHWAQEAFDQAGMLREYVKWDYELRQPVQLEAVVDRALELAMAEPRGPVYLTLPREVLAQPLGELDHLVARAPPGRRAGGSPIPRGSRRRRSVLAAARQPADRHRRAGPRPARRWTALVALAEAGAFPVLEANPTYVNFPADHPCHVGLVLREPGLPGDRPRPTSCS